MNNYTITFEPGNRKIIVPEGSSIKEALTSAGLDFDFPCGGRGTCGKCRIKVLEKNLDPTEKELKYLEEKELLEGIRLACQIEIHDNITLQLNTEKENTHNILKTSTERSYSVEPLIQKVYTAVKAPTLEDQSSDFKRLKESIMLKYPNCKAVKIKIDALQDLPYKIRESEQSVTVIIDKNEIIGVEQGNTTNKMLGIAFDIGTTTIVAYLMDLYTGKELAVSSSLNPQVKFGADVISRTSYANQNEDGIKTMQDALLKIMNKLIDNTVEISGLSRKDIYAITVVGNTCMHHLFLGLTPRYIAAAPYVPVISETIELDAFKLNFNINKAGKVFVLPNIAGFVGADTVAVVLATEMDKSKDIKLAIDIGTNGEMVLGSSKKLVSCSTAAGPAFEGAQISSGMRGASGAIDHIRFGEALTYTVIDNEKPKGICGSGLLDIIACFVEFGIINKRGKILSPDKFTNPAAKAYENHIISYDGANAFLVVPESETSHGRPIMITQDDVTSLQLAKGSIAAGIKILIDKCGVNIDDINEVLLAGAFGNYMDPHSACMIGLIPKELESKIRMVGNAAGTGAKLALVSRSEYEHSNTIASSVKYVELAAEQSFNKAFAKGLQF
ncbi:DUF4445 domain-containing protein [Clostridium sp. PL3]|uniref:DUF4445 domain-containing protein n=1 Tax=Clostridium thailandense TaxID=2794346 RepID=A0A949X257_9CLOT|nr:ASKHA domain-containing protein [Clostridium thailandense]MBV7272824.1 DUF4445 domain-containing protein [Clostridium thailandense]